MPYNNERTRLNKDELALRLTNKCNTDGPTEVARGMTFYRYSAVSGPNHGVYSPAVCVVAQGAKEVHFREERLRYDPANFLLISLDVPVVSRVVEASPAKPYLGLKLDLDPTLIASVMVECGALAARSSSSVSAMDVSHMPDDLLDAFVRLIRLLDNPDEFRIVSPMVTKEIVYRLLRSEQSARLRQMASFGDTTNRISKAVQTLRNRFNQPLSIEELASELGMSVSSFHQHFKTATSMSPLQFQKLLRLQEAKRLLLSDGLDASTAAVKVGYEDASQFTREYKRLFGEPPMRDVARFKKLAAG